MLSMCCSQKLYMVGLSFLFLKIRTQGLTKFIELIKVPLMGLMLHTSEIIRKFLLHNHIFILAWLQLSVSRACRTPLLPWTSGCFPLPAQEAGEERLPFLTRPPERPPRGWGKEVSPQQWLFHQLGEIWPFFQMCGKVKKPFFSFLTEYGTWIPSQLTPRALGRLQGHYKKWLWKPFSATVNGQCRHRPNNNSRAADTRQPCFRGVLTVPFQHMNITSRSSNPMVLIKFSISHRPHHSFPTHPEGRSLLPGQTHSMRGWPRTASRFTAKQTGQLDLHAIAKWSPKLPHIWFLAQLQQSVRLAKAEKVWGKGERR